MEDRTDIMPCATKGQDTTNMTVFPDNSWQGHRVPMLTELF